MKRRQAQQSFMGKEFEKPGDSFGGSLLKGNPKGKRPLDSKLPIQLTMRATRSVLRLPKTIKIVNDTLMATAHKHGVRVYDWANVGNHLHILLKIRSVTGWAAFIRELSGRIAQLVGETVAQENGLQFWRFRPHTRIVRGWQKTFRSAKEYVYLNQLEALGFIKRKETKTLKDLRMIWADG